MGVDYYNILKVSKGAGEDELRRAYKKLAMRWHPDKHPSGAKGLAEAKFKQICEAYDVLSDPSKRQIYDVYGDEGLKYNVSSPSAATAASLRRNNTTKSNHSSFRYRDGGTRGVGDNDVDIMRDFFGDFGTDNVRTLKKNDNNVEFGRSDSSKDAERFRSSRMRRNPSPEEVKKAEPVENMLGCTLEELYKGSKRKMQISRIVSDDSGKPKTVEEVLAIDIRPGWKKGTKITFPGKGTQEPDLMPGDLIFVIDEKPHPTFKRDGNDLVVSQKISLVEALTGKTLNLTTLDGRSLNIDVSDIIKPGHEVVISGEGMPISKDPKKKGNLIIKFDVKFPKRLSADQKADIKRVLG